MLWKMEKAIRVVDDIYGASLASSLDGLHPMPHNDPNRITISSLRAKDPVGSNRDEIGEESPLEGQLLELPTHQTTAQTTRAVVRNVVFLYVLSGKTTDKSSYELGI